MPEDNEYIIDQSNDAGTGEDWENIDPEVLYDYNDNNNSSGSGSSGNTGSKGDGDPTPSEDDIFSHELLNNNKPPKPSDKWQKFQRVATVLGLASAMVTLIYFITKIASK